MPFAASDVSIVIPAYRDQAALRRCLEGLAAEGLAGQAVVALGEPDADAEATTAAFGVSCVTAEGVGRGLQMNAGARQTTGAVLLFLHADTRLPEGAAEAVARALSGGSAGGAFSRRFAPTGYFLRFTCWLADWRGRWFGWFLGDQAIFVRRDVYEQLKGFRSWRTFEDLDFSRRMAAAGRTCLLKPGVVSSARRFKRRGAIRQTWSDLMLTLRYLFRGDGSQW